MEEGESMGLIPLVFFQKTVSRVVGGRNSISKRLDSLLSISGKVSELLEEEALLSCLQCCNQNLVLRFSRISNKNASLSSCQSWEEKQGSRREKKKVTPNPKVLGYWEKGQHQRRQLREFSKIFWPIGFLEAKSTLLWKSQQQPPKLMKVSDHWPSTTVLHTIKAKRPPLYY